MPRSKRKTMTRRPFPSQPLFVRTLEQLDDRIVPAFVVRTDSAIDAAGITTIRDTFRADLGGGTVAGANGSFGGLRREINWDGVPAAKASPNAFPANFFNTTSPRGAVFSTPGTGFEVSGNTADAGTGQPSIEFANLDASYPTLFNAFSPQRLFTSVGSNVLDVAFFVPGTNVPATVAGFGAIFSDVDLANTSKIEFFDVSGNSLNVTFAPPTAGNVNGGFSFVGGFEDTGLASIAKVRITSGNVTVGTVEDLGNNKDVVVLDDFLFSEPQELGQTAYALSNNSLIRFSTTNPTAAGALVTVTGLNADDNLVGIDFRPQNGHLYGLGYNGTAGTVQLYGISPISGKATAIGTTGTFVDAGGNNVRIGVDATTQFGFDFNPTVDRIRVVNSAGQDFRMNPNTGGFIDGDLGGAAGSVTGLNMDGAINGDTTITDGAAYTNNTQNATVTTLYTLDASSNSIFIQNPPNAGTQVTVANVTLGGSKLTFTNVNGFDIPLGVNVATSNAQVTSGTAYAVLTVGGTTQLYSIDLVTGVATAFGAVNGATAVQGFAIHSSAGGLPSVALGASGTTITRLNIATPGTNVSKTIMGVTAGETLVGIDYRPTTGQLYGFGVNPATDTGSLYIVDPQTGAATVVGTASSIAYVDGSGTTVELPDPATTGYGFDFNPTVDRIRVTTSSGLNFRLNPISGGAVDGDLGGAAGSVAGVNPDGPVNGLPVGSTGVSSAAYTNSFAGAAVTSLYTLDAASDSLYIQNPPNMGTQSSKVAVTLGGNPLDFSDVTGFDIPSGVSVATSNSAAAGLGYASLVVGGATNLYSIDLTTGVAKFIGASGVANSTGLSVANSPAGTISFRNATFSGSEAGPTLDLVLIRTGGNTGPVSVTVNLTDGTAKGGTDFTATPIMVTFADGATTATASVPITNDTIFEGDETFTATLSSPTNSAVLGAIPTATVTIVDNDTQPTVTIGDAKVTEGNTGTTAMTFTLSLSNASSKDITVQVTTADGTATAGKDYTAVTGKTVTFTAGTTTATITVDVTGETIFEADETFTVAISAPTNATLGATTKATGTILNDDTAPTFSINNVSVAEGNTGTTTFTFTVSLSEASEVPATVTVNTKDLTATAGTDYTAVTGKVLTFAPGTLTQTVAISVNGDTTIEPDETFQVILSAPTGATIKTDTGIGTIFNDDGPIVSIAKSSVTEGNTGTTPMVFTLTLSQSATTDVVVVVNTTDGTAKAGSDYTALTAQKVTIPAGATTATFSVSVIGDTIIEPDETFTVTIASATGASVSGTNGSAIGTILNDDTATNPLLVGVPPFVAGTDAGTVGTVTLFNPDKTVKSTLTPFPGFTGGIRTVTADFNNDGTPDIVVGTGPGRATRVLVLDGVTQKELFSIDPFEASFTGGVYVAAGDINGDGRAELVITPDEGGGPRVRIFNGTNFTQINDFFGIADKNFRGGARAAVGDINGDGFGDLVVAAGFGGGPRISTFSGKTMTNDGSVPPNLFGDFFAFEERLRNGAFVAVGDINGDGLADLVAGAGPGGGPRVTVFGSVLLQQNKQVALADFFAGDLNNRGGIRVSVKNLDNDSKADLVVGAGTGGGSRITAYTGLGLAANPNNPASTFDFNNLGSNGIFVG